uniref:(northern house mosquito) hypothetical protein n=1 Tax=Culex pipiens TaxID=7175 RepID=A0A8D8AJ12_CULPI
MNQKNHSTNRISISKLFIHMICKLFGHPSALHLNRWLLPGNQGLPCYVKKRGGHVYQLVVHCVATFLSRSLGMCPPTKQSAKLTPTPEGMSPIRFKFKYIWTKKKTNSPTHPKKKNQSLTITTKGPHFCRHKSCRDIWAVEEAK